MFACVFMFFSLSHDVFFFPDFSDFFHDLFHEFSMSFPWFSMSFP